MPIEKHIERFEQINTLVRLRATGTPQQLARKLNISERHTHEYIRKMRSAGAPIVYCRKSQNYYYTEKTKFVFGFFRD
jgi:predicted DNA-binding transcriptional regulator YafY